MRRQMQDKYKATQTGADIKGRLSLGVLAGSRKKDERRLAIHPLHVERIDPDLLKNIYLERGYGNSFGVTDGQLAKYVAGLRTSDQLLAECDVILLPKPLPQDLENMREGQVLWGWPHCVQDKEITQLSIERKLTLIAFEAMNKWSSDGSFSQHIFRKNNELAGYSSVMHAMQLIGITGEYGRPLRACVICYGATGHGAVTALNALGVDDIHILVPKNINIDPPSTRSISMKQFERDKDNPVRCHVLGDSGQVPMPTYLAGFDIVVNCVLQDTGAPLIFITGDDLEPFASGCLLIDVSCDAGMGFSWARPTSFENPIFTVGKNINYYAVDHSPSLLWQSATWVISEALLPYLKAVLGGSEAWDSEETIRRAIEIRDGVIQNKAILSFQHRSLQYPYPVL